MKIIKCKQNKHRIPGILHLTKYYDYINLTFTAVNVTATFLFPISGWTLISTAFCIVGHVVVVINYSC